MFPQTFAFGRRANKGESLVANHHAQFVDSQYALFHDLSPIIPTEMLRVQLPCAESLWRAPSADLWLKCFQETSKPLRRREAFFWLIDGYQADYMVTQVPISL